MERRIGVNTWLWCSRLTDATLPDLVAHVAGLGFDAIELPWVSPGDWDAESARGLLETHGLDAVISGVMLPGRNLVATSREEIAATRDYLHELIDIAAILGASTVAGPFYTEHGRRWRLGPDEREAAYLQLRTGLGPVIEHAAERGMTLAIGPLNRHESSLLNTVEQTFDALEPLLGPGLGIALDTYHLNIEERDIAAAVARALGHIAHVQVSGNDRGTVGADHFDWREFLHALDLAGYAGPLSLKSFIPEEGELAAAASIWRPLASSQDALAADSLGYLRNLQAGEPR